jgi:hypothetical protein
MLKREFLFLLCTAFFASPALAGSLSDCPCTPEGCCPGPASHALAVPTQTKQMPGTQQNGSMASHPMSGHSATTFIEQILAHDTAGTSAVPGSTPSYMLMAQRGSWMLMFHGEAFINSQQQTGARGGDKVFGTSWFMPMAQRQLGPGIFTGRVMLSLDPATITNRRYPELFQIGETAYGNPIVDGQHPHDFFMELALLYDIKLGENTLLSFYAAPVGDPALGPEAFHHRASASEDPLAPLGHHLQDSTHISDDVFTVGLTHKIVRVEASAFHGGEPDEFRWNIDTGAVNSWSARLTINPASNWSGQYSIGRLKAPEQLFPGEDVLRMTASISYNRPFTNGNWASMLLWGRNRDIPDGQVFNSYLFESTVRFAKHNFAWTRIENVDRSNLLELGENPLPPGFEERFLARVPAYSFGYDREFNFIPHVASAVGAQYTLYTKPSFLDPFYGSNPMGVVAFVRLRTIPSQKSQ